MNAMQLLTGPAAQALGWALLHLLWQAAIVAGILAAVLALLPRQSASARYVASISALGLVFAMFVATAVRAYDPAAEPIAAASVVESVSIEPASVPVLIAAIATEGWRERLADAVATARQSLPSVVAIWLAGVVILSSRLMLSWARARNLVHRHTVEASAHWQRVAARLSEALGLRRAVRLLESAAVEVPSVIGTLRPVILLPASTLTGLTPQQLEMVLAHELAHIRRHDFLVNLLQAFVETLMFYHPAIWWISHRVRVERENCCDDLAVSVCGDPIQYARALTRLEELRDDALAIAMAANGGSLFDRIRRIASDRAESTGISSRSIAAVATLTIVLVAVAIPSLPALAQREESAAPSSATSSIDVVEPQPGTAVDADADLDAEGDTDYDSAYDYDYDAPEPPEAPEPPVPDLDLDLDLMDIPMPVVAPAVPRSPHAPFPPSVAPVVAPMPPGVPMPPAAIAPLAMAYFGGDDDRDDDREIGASGKLTVDELISLRAVGVTPAYVTEMRAIFPALTMRELSGMRAVGVTAEYIREMRGSGIEVSTPREATSLRAVGVTPAFVKSMRDAGFTIATARDATDLRAIGISLDYIREMRDAGFTMTSPRDAVSMKAVGVTAQWVREMRSAGFTIASSRDAASMRAVGVTPQWVRAMRDAGVKIEDAGDATTLRAVGVTPEWIRKLAAAGYSNLSVRELTRLAAAGVDDDFIREMEQYRRKN